MDRISSSATSAYPSSKIDKISQKEDSNYNYRNFFRRKLHLNNIWNFLSSSSRSILQSTPLSSFTLAVSKKHIIKNAVLVLTILLGLIQNSLSSPVFVDNPSIAQFQSGRNIRHLPCIVRKSGLSGTCMFAIDCIKQNGTHLGTCIDRFYFGSCCRIKDDYFAQDINDNSIDQNTISHFLNDVNTTPNSVSSYKPTTLQEQNNQHKSKPTLPVPYVPISTVIPSMQNRENSVNSSSNEIPESNSLLLNDPKIEILSSSQTSSVSISSSSSSSSSALQKKKDPLTVNETLDNLNSTRKNTLHTTQSMQTNFSLPSSSSSLPSSSQTTSPQTTKKQTSAIPTKPIKITNKPTFTIKQTSTPKTTSTHKTSSIFTTENEVLKETISTSKISLTHPTKLTHNTKQPTSINTKLTTTIKNVITTNPTNYPTKPSSTLMIPLLTTSYPVPLAENHIKETTESVKFTTFQMVETTTFTPTTTTAITKIETKKPPLIISTKSPAPIIYVSNKPLYTKRPLTTHRTKGTKRPVKPENSSSSNANRKQPTPTTPLVETTIKPHPSKKPVIVTKKPLSTRPPITKPTGSLGTTGIPPERISPTKKPDSYKTDTITTVKITKIPLAGNTMIPTTKIPRPKPKPTAEIVRVSSTYKPIPDNTTMKITTSSSADNMPQVNISLTTPKSDLSPSSTSNHPPLHLHTTKSSTNYHTSSITSISSTQIITTQSPSTTFKPLSSSPLISTLSTSSYKQSTTIQPSSKPSSTRFPSRPTIARQPSTQKPPSLPTTSSILTTKKPILTTSKTTSASTTTKPNPSTITKSSTTLKPSTSKLPIVTKHPLTTKPPIITSSIPTRSTISISISSTTTPLQAITTTTTTTTTMKPSALVTWTNVDNAPQTNNSENISASDKNNDDWQPKPIPEWVVKPSTVPTTEFNKITSETVTNNFNGSEPTTEDIIASSISSVLDQLNNQTIANITTTFNNTTPNPWVWTTESKLNVSNTLSTSMEGLANISNATFANGEGFNSTSSSTAPTIPSLEGIDYKQICGKRMYPEPRIVGGANAAFGRWPWQISLRQWRTSTYLHKCGAALLNENWAITAAHCVDNVPPSDLLLRLGEYDLAEEEEPYSYQERRVQIVASHPQFDPRTFEYDLALLRFYEPVLFQPNIIPVCVPDNDYDFLGQTAYVTGWGRLYEDGPLPSVLQEVSVPVINNTICETMYRAAGYIEHIPHIFICAGWKKGGYDSCEGDSGGPMVLQRERDKRFVLGGVISWGIGCAEPNQPGVYTRISEFRDWINQILQF